MQALSCKRHVAVSTQCASIIVMLAHATIQVAQGGMYRTMLMTVHWLILSLSCTTTATLPSFLVVLPMNVSLLGLPFLVRACHAAPFLP